MNWYTRPEDQGQIVEVSYAYSEGCAYRRVFDKSDRSEVVYEGEIDWDREPEYPDQDHIPCVEEWVRII